MKTKRKLVVAAMVLVAGTMAWAQWGLEAAAAPAKDEPQTRTVSGEVMDESSRPLGDAIVHLKNTKNLSVSTYITRDDGKYRFTALVPNVDYEIFAEHDGKKSPTKTLSAFESRPSVVLNLHIDMRK